MSRLYYDTEPIRISMHRKTVALLDKLAETGLYGRDRGDVARTLITAGVRQAKMEHPQIFNRSLEPHAKR